MVPAYTVEKPGFRAVRKVQLDKLTLTSEPYLSYMAHFIGKDWNLHAKCLQTHYMPEAHTGVNLKEVLAAMASRPR